MSKQTSHINLQVPQRTSHKRLLISEQTSHIHLQVQRCRQTNATHTNMFCCTIMSHWLLIMLDWWHDWVLIDLLSFARLRLLAYNILTTVIIIKRWMLRLRTLYSAFEPCLPIPGMARWPVPRADSWNVIWKHPHTRRFTCTVRTFVYNYNLARLKLAVIDCQIQV